MKLSSYWGGKLLQKKKKYMKNHVCEPVNSRKKKIKDISIFCTICRESWLTNIKIDKKICIFCAYFT